MVTLAIWGEVTHGAILTKCGTWAHIDDVIRFAIFGDCRLRDVSLVKGEIFLSPIDLTCRPYNTGHTTMWRCEPAPCDISFKARRIEISLLTYLLTDCFDYTPKELTHFYSATRMQSADYAVASCHFVCPSVRLSQAGILSKQLNISSKFFFTVG